MQNTSRNDLSLRHLPDLSDSSFSFEIPAGSNQDFLLNNDDDFFGAASDSFATPAPATSRKSPHPLILNHLTPKAFAEGRLDAVNRISSRKMALSNSFRSNTVQPQISTEDSTKAHTKYTMTQKLQTDVPLRNEIMSTPQRMRRLRDEIQDLAEPKSSAISAVASSIESNELQSAVASAVAKNGGNALPPILASTAPRSPRFQSNDDPRQVIQPSLCPSENEDIDVSVISTLGGGLAERLVMYSQNLVGSHALSIPTGNESSTASAFTVSSSHLELHCSANDSLKTSETTIDDPLTISQLSPLKTKPEKRTSSPVSAPGSNVPPPLTRRKRPGSPIRNIQPAKREKTSAIASSSRAPPPGKRFVPRKRTPSANLSSASGRAKTKSSFVIRTSRDPVIESKASSGSSGMSSLGQDRPSGTSSGSLTNSSGPSLERSEGSTQTSRNHSTRPVEFKFQSDMRVKARRNESSARIHEVEPQKKQKLHTPYTVPDFKSSHSSQDALLTSLKGNIKPIVPLQIELHTDARARERSKFNEQIREKELQASRALEDKKRRQAEEEERELKEQRKKAVPRAHPVPEWYKSAPRRKELRPHSRNEGAN